MSSPLNSRGGFVLCLDTKNQKSSQAKGFFAAQTFALQNRQNLGCKSFAPCLAPRMPALLQKFTMPCNRTALHRFTRFRPKLPA
jgi:hypothetical protein